MKEIVFLGDRKLELREPTPSSMLAQAMDGWRWPLIAAALLSLLAAFCRSSGAEAESNGGNGPQRKHVAGRCER
jgi:hypothetical protein